MKRIGGPRRPALWGALLLCAPAGPTAAQGPVQLVSVPARPAEGSFVHLVLRSAGDLGGVNGRLADEPVRFERDSAGVWHALAAIPIGTHGQVPLALDLRGPDGRTRREHAVLEVSEGSFEIERLTVAPRFAAPPDSLLAARIRAELERAMDVSRRSRETPRLWTGPFARPRPSRVTSPFGGGREFNGQLQSRHLGVDLAGTSGALVRAAHRGVVALVAETYYGGNVIYLDHGRGLVTAYLHLSATLVAQGDTVSRGMPIGRVGATGRVTAPHLHWVARYGTLTVDPLSLEALGLEAFGPPPEGP